jgi:hypothetical protein
MHKVKSAPANLCLMKNNRDKSKLVCNKKNNIIPLLFNNNKNIVNNNKNIVNNNKNIVNKNIVNNNKNIVNNNINYLKNNKKILYNVNEITNDMIQNSKLLDSEELNIISVIINYTFENIYKKKNLNELKNYIISCIIRYFIMFVFHNFIIHDIDGKYIHTLEIIHKINF